MAGLASFVVLSRGREVQGRVSLCTAGKAVYGMACHGRDRQACQGGAGNGSVSLVREWQARHGSMC